MFEQWPVTGRLVTAFGLAMLVPGCSWLGWLGSNEYVPDAPGVYAIQGKDADASPQRLDGDRRWELKTWAVRSQLDPQIRFVIDHPQLPTSRETLDEAIKLRKLSWVRSEIGAGGEIKPVRGGQWAVTDLDAFAVPLAFHAVESRPDVIRAVPLRPLERGLYSLEVASRSKVILQARFGVQWPGVDQQAYSTATCVDRYTGPPLHYLPCAEQQQVFNTKWLRLYLVNPELRNAVAGDTLVIRGVVANASAVEQGVPMLEGQLQTTDGKVVKVWQFDPGIAAVPAGGSVSFRTELRDFPAAARNVYVRFAFSIGKNE